MNKLQIPDDIAIDYITSTSIVELVKQRHYIAMQTMYTNLDVIARYQKACETSTSGGIFVPIKFAVFDCYKTINPLDDDSRNEAEDTLPFNITITDIFIDNGECFPSGEVCQHYVENPTDWLVDTKRLFGYVCDVRNYDDDDGDDVAYKSLITTDVHVPAPADVSKFKTAPPHYNQDRQSKCMSAFKHLLFDEKTEQLSDEMFYHASRTHVQLLQISNDPPPTKLTQREYYDVEDGIDKDHLTTYQNLCQASNGRFDSFSGILDCIGVGDSNRDRQQIIVTEYAATCFPPAESGSGCDGYTMEQWRIDTVMSTAHLSCTVRSENVNTSTSMEETVSSSAHHQTAESNGASIGPPVTSSRTSQKQDGNRNGEYIKSSVIVILTILIGVGFVVVRYGRRPSHHRLTDPVVNTTMIDDYPQTYVDNFELGELS
jgi:hypothetical protein